MKCIYAFWAISGLCHTFKAKPFSLKHISLSLSRFHKYSHSPILIATPCLEDSCTSGNSFNITLHELMQNIKTIKKNRECFVYQWFFKYLYQCRFSIKNCRLWHCKHIPTHEIFKHKCFLGFNCILMKFKLLCTCSWNGSECFLVGSYIVLGSLLASSIFAAF